MVDHTFIFFADLCEIYCHIKQLRDSWRGLYRFFYFALKEPVVCRQLWCTKQRGYLVKFHPIHEKLPRTNQRARQESHTTNQNCTVKNRLYMFSEWNEFFKRQWSAALIIQYRGENVYKTGSSLVAKDET